MTPLTPIPLTLGCCPDDLQWVVEQVEEQIRAGKTVTEEIETVKGDVQELPLAFETASRISSRGRKGRRDKFLRRVDYTPCERLELLISATEHAVVDVGEIGFVFSEFVGERKQSLTKIEFVSKEENVPATSFEFGELSSRLPAVQKLRELLSQLRNEVRTRAH